MVDHEVSSAELQYIFIMCIGTVNTTVSGTVGNRTPDDG